ncbi:hypothetical protein PIB30_074325 [Stylosanthes scabra]|uniref:Putative plant transposon protein domain-containing protein n=1 Tax=Stylosanthes scabra TaxID=79078 RepID=A0ABU6VQL2_9FABA|nr:hypothetical protein [Stylosanthes scabra]
MIREFYANAWRLEEEKNQPKTYMTMVRGVDISFAPDAIRKALKTRERPLPNVASYHERKNENLRLEEVQEYLCEEGGEWIYRRLDQQQEESRKSFEAINTRMDRMDDQLSFLCYSNQMVNETMYYPYQNTSRQFREMEAQGVPVTIANLAIHRHREEEMNQERMRHNQTVQEAAAEKAREANKGKEVNFLLRNPLESLLCDFFINDDEKLQSVKLR